MNSKPPLQSGYVNTPPNPTSPSSLCFPPTNTTTSSSSSSSQTGGGGNGASHKDDKQQKQSSSGLCGCHRSPKSHCVSAIGVLILVLAYTALGSILFVTLEGEHEDDLGTMETAVAASKPYPRSDLVNADIRSRTVDRLWSITEDLNILYKENWTRLAAQEVQHFQDTLLRAVRNSKTQQPGAQPALKTHKWSYASAFLYSLTLITTIGYGGVSPRSQWGRIAALIYALFGIPIVLLYLSAMGEGLSSIMRCIFRLLRISSSATSKPGKSGSFSKKQQKDNNMNSADKLDIEKRPHNYHVHDDSNEKMKHYHQHKPPNLHSGGGGAGGAGGYVNSSSSNGASSGRRCSTSSSTTSAPSNPLPTVPISVCIMILICYITLGAVLFHKLQPWNVLESLYFCFTSLGTIGFGDLQPQGQLAQYLASGYILFGMAVVAMCFSLIQTELVVWLRRFGVQDHHQHSASHQQAQFVLIDNPGGPLHGSSEDLALVTVSMTPSKIS